MVGGSRRGEAKDRTRVVGHLGRPKEGDKRNGRGEEVCDDR